MFMPALPTFSVPKLSIPSSNPSLPVNTKLPTPKMPKAGRTLDYEILDGNWYKTLPYGFRFFNRIGEQYSIYLPINPSDITITTHYATNVTATLYGTIEEHSEQRYFDIEISGTTGIAPQYTNPGWRSVDNIPANDGGRANFSVDSNWGNASFGGFFAKTLGTVNNIANKVQDLAGQRKNKTGIKTDKTGYTAFHRLYKFFLRYKQDTSGVINDTPRKSKSGGDAHPLFFLNYKDNNQYKCAIQRFVLKKSASDPMLYNYTIILRAYELTDIEKKTDTQNDEKARMADLGLNTVKGSSILGDIKQSVGSVKGIMGAGLGGINTLGR